jgi:hypothetical protein
MRQSWEALLTRSSPFIPGLQVAARLAAYSCAYLMGCQPSSYAAWFANGCTSVPMSSPLGTASHAVGRNRLASLLLGFTGRPRDSH